MVPAMTMLYGFALENALKGGLVHDRPDFDYLKKEGNRFVDFDAISGHDLEYLCSSLKATPYLDAGEVQLLRDVSTIIVAQGRYGAGHPKRPDQNLVVYYMPELRGFVLRMLEWIRAYVRESFAYRRPSPLGTTVEVYSDNPAVAYGVIKKVGATLIRRDGLDAPVL